MNKKLIIATVLISVVVVCWTLFYAVYPETNVNTLNLLPTSIRIERDTIQLGTVKYGEKRYLVFRLFNTGTQPLLIRNVKPSCGCTEVDWEKQPVATGKMTEIKAVFKPASLGRFMKSIEVLCNTEQQLYKVHLRGEVVE